MLKNASAARRHRMDNSLIAFLITRSGVLAAWAGRSPAAPTVRILIIQRQFSNGVRKTCPAVPGRPVSLPQQLPAASEPHCFGLPGASAELPQFVLIGSRSPSRTRPRGPSRKPERLRPRAPDELARRRAARTAQSRLSRCPQARETMGSPAHTRSQFVRRTTTETFRRCQQ